MLRLHLVSPYPLVLDLCFVLFVALIEYVCMCVCVQGMGMGAGMQGGGFNPQQPMMGGMQPMQGGMNPMMMQGSALLLFSFLFLLLCLESCRSP
jgi:hypothetical protein